MLVLNIFTEPIWDYGSFNYRCRAVPADTRLGLEPRGYRSHIVPKKSEMNNACKPLIPLPIGSTKVLSCCVDHIFLGCKSYE